MAYLSATINKTYGGGVVIYVSWVTSHIIKNEHIPMTLKNRN